MHAQCVKRAHSRYKKFVDYGDAEGYPRRVERVRRVYGDIDAPAGASASSKTPGP